MEKQDKRMVLVFDFLRRIARHNDREWFADHRPLYEEAKEAFESMVAQLIARLATFDASVAHLDVKDCTYRFYRDTRFSPDKSPYKTHMGAYVSARGKKSFHGGYYLHIEPGNCMLAGGAYMLPSPILKAVRHTIYDNMDEFCAIVESPAFQQYFPEMGCSRLKTVPAGFPRDYRYADYLRPKDYSCAGTVPDSTFLDIHWLDTTEKAFRVLKPFLDFINDTIDDYDV